MSGRYIECPCRHRRTAARCRVGKIRLVSGTEYHEAIRRVARFTVVDDLNDRWSRHRWSRHRWSRHRWSRYDTNRLDSHSVRDDVLIGVIAECDLQRCSSHINGDDVFPLRTSICEVVWRDLLIHVFLSSNCAAIVDSVRSICCTVGVSHPCR